MENTVCQGCTKKKCPNKIDSFWKDQLGNVKTVTDCAPKRTLIMLQDLTNRQIAQQGAIENLRNEMDRFRSQVQCLANLTKPQLEVRENDATTALPHQQLQDGT